MNLWTLEEDKVLSDTSLNYDEIIAQLPHRSRKGIWQRAHKLGFNRDISLIAKINSENQRKKEWKTLLDDRKFCEVIDGELLGDGCIFRKKVKNRNCYEYTFIAGSIHREYAEYVHGIIAPKLKSKAKIKVVKPNKNGYPNAKVFYSVRFSSVVFHDFYDRWYPNGSIKTTYPKDIQLLPSTCMHWYLGDGSLDSSFRRKMFEITLHTENFKHSEVDQLSNFLSSSVSIKTGTRKSKKYKAIRIHGKYAREFLKYIGSSPVKCFNYKWRDWKKGG